MNVEEGNSPDAEFLGQTGAKVEGQTRLEAAYGAGDGDEGVMVASVAGGTKEHEQAQLGTIFDQKYRPWEGTLNPRWARNWAILRHHVYGLFSKGHRPYGMATKLILFAAFLMSLGDLGLSFIGSIFGESDMSRLFGVSRDNLYGHVLGFWPRNALCFPIIAALLIGGMISEDRMNGTSAIYFSRPLNRIDYTAMKFLSVAIILFLLIVGTLGIYYTGDILLRGEGWSFLLDTLPMFLGAALAGLILVITYSSIGLALSSVSRGKFFPAVALLGIFLGTKLIAFLIDQVFERSVLYLLSPYDCVAHVGQALVDTTSTYDHPWSWSLVSLVAMNALSMYILASRVSSMEVTRE